MQLEILFIGVILLLLVGAWVGWAKTDRPSVNSKRRAAFVGGLGASSFSLIFYCLFMGYAYHIGGFGNVFAAALRWMRPGLGIALVGLLGVSGKGRSRIFALVSSVCIVLLWVAALEGI